MGFDIIDRRDSGSEKNKSAGSRQKFIKRNKRAIKDALDGVIGDSEGFTDIVGGAKNKQKKFNIKGIEEPTFEHGEGGETEHVISGNDRFSVGDLIDKPGGGAGGGSDPSADGEGEDAFTFYLDRKEFLELLFEDLELPELIKQSLLNDRNTERVPDGFVTQGPPSQLALIQTFRNSIGRRIGLNRKPLKEEIKRLQEELARLTAHYAVIGAESDEATVILQQMTEIAETIEKLKHKLRAIPFLDPIDLRFRHQEEVPLPTISAAMFCIMDVSGSMGEHHKICAKLFFFLLYMFLQKQYEKVAIIFIRHTHEAKEVDEKEFFYSTETGGTMIAPALELMLKIAKERFDIAHWNLYVAQASDGDSFGDDAQDCYRILTNKILPIVQYMVYIQIGENRRGGNSEPNNQLWHTYKKVAAEQPNFDMNFVNERKDSYPVFRKLFEKKV